MTTVARVALVLAALWAVHARVATAAAARPPLPIVETGFAARWSGFVAVTLFVSSLALAEDPKVPVQAEVVFASTAAGTVEPSLVKMRDTLAHKVKYLTLKKLDSRKLVLTKAAVAALEARFK